MQIRIPSIKFTTAMSNLVFDISRNDHSLQRSWHLCKRKVCSKKCLIVGNQFGSFVVRSHNYCKVTYPLNMYV